MIVKGSMIWISMVLLFAQLGHAGFGGPIFPREKPVIENLQECKSAVRKSVGIAHSNPTWGEFHIECKDGKVARMSVPKTSPIFKNWPRFVRSNPDIFGVDHNQLLEEGAPWNGHITLTQTWKGYQIPHSWLWDVRRWGDATDVILGVRSVDTRAWKSDATPRISSAAAVGVITAFWSREGRPAKRASSDHIFAYSGELGCGTSRTPRLAWEIYGVAVDGRSFPPCLVDAVSGHICGRCELPAPTAVDLKTLGP